MIFASTPATGSAAHKGPGRYLSAGVGYGRVHGPNPILVKFREKRSYPAGYWAHRLGKGDLPVDVVATDAQVDHACRVLSRLASLEEVSHV